MMKPQEAAPEKSPPQPQPDVGTQPERTLPGPVRLVLIAAMSRNRVLARDGKIPWHQPRDIAFFRARTAGHWLLLGRTTYEQLKDWFQPGQVPVVLTRQTHHWSADTGHTVGSVEEAVALAAAEGVSELTVCGGGQVYEASLPSADEVLLTTVDTEVEGDTWFPVLPQDEWVLTNEEFIPADAENPLPMTLTTWQRVRGR